MSKFRRYYTEEEVATVKQYAGKKTAGEIALILGRSRHSVLNWASNNEVSLRKVGQYHDNAKLTDLQAEMVGALADAGFTGTEINKACFPHVTYGCITGITSGSNRGQRAELR